MTLEIALRLTEIMLGFAFALQSAEHFVAADKGEQRLFLLRFVLGLLLIAGFQTQWVCLALVILGLFILQRFQGPYNGGSDRMGLLVLCCLTVTCFLPVRGQEVVFGYLALQLVLSYFISGGVKIVNSDWRSGRALQDVFLFSAYPVSENTRAWAKRPRLLWGMSWAVILFELLFPFALLTQETLAVALVIAACFHLANAFLFGLNRFFWVWMAAYPSIFWLQHRIFAAG